MLRSGRRAPSLDLVDKRILGLSNSYSVVFSAAGPWQLSSEEAGRRLFGTVASGGQATGVVLRNGGRLHLGEASRPVYATPECGSVPELVVHDKAGERILEGLLAGSGQRLLEQDIDGEISLLKVNLDPADSPYGCQEDYVIARRGEFGQLADVLIPFLVTRQLICGAGAVARTPGGAVYCLSRQAEPAAGADGPFRATRRRRPFISTRDEPRDAAAGSRRLRVMVSDPSMSETTGLLKAGATDLVLRMADAGTVPPELALGKPVQAMEEVSRDITGRRLLRLADGRQLSALDIQRDYLARARDFTDERGTDAVSQRVLGLWQRALDAIAAGNLDAIAREIDWVIKHQFIERYRAANDLPLSAPQVAYADLTYHSVDRGRGLYYQLQRDGAVERTARDIDIFEAKTVRPAPSRYRRAG